MLNMRKFFLVAVVIVFGGCEPTINTQQITQSAQNLRENVRNIDTQRITQGAQNLKENLQNFQISIEIISETNINWYKRFAKISVNSDSEGGCRILFWLNFCWYQKIAVLKLQSTKNYKKRRVEVPTISSHTGHIILTHHSHIPFLHTIPTYHIPSTKKSQLSRKSVFLRSYCCIQTAQEI